MLFKKYHIIVFKDGIGQCRNLRFRGLTCLLVLAGLLATVGVNLVLWGYFVAHQHMRSRLHTAEQTVQAQNLQLASLSQKVSSLSNGLTRMSDLDAKIRVMLNLERGDVSTVSALGGSESGQMTGGFSALHRQDLLARKMHNFLDQLNTEVQLEEIRQQELLEAIRKSHNILASTPSIWPTRGWISSHFGYRKSPFTGRQEFHKGVDISGPVGTPIYAPARGKVVHVGQDGAYGLMVALEHANGVVTRYGHINDSSLRIGQTVQRGDLVATMGNTGRSTGPHLHYEVRMDGMPVNPERYVLN